MLEALKLERAAQRYRPERRDRRPLPLVQLDRLDHVELADGRRCSAAPRSASTTATRAESSLRATSARRLDDALALRRRHRRHVLRRRRGVLRELHEGRRRRRRRPATCAGCARSARPARRCAIECYRWLAQHCRRWTARRIWLDPISGGTDFAGAFVAGTAHAAGQCRRDAMPLPRRRGRGVDEPDARAAAARSSTRSASSSAPSRCRRCRSTSGATPTAARYRDSYFDMYPGVWRHGDWIADHAARRRDHLRPQRRDDQPARHPHGHRELYSAVEALPEVLDSLVVDLEYLGRESYMPLFVVLREGVVARRRADAAPQGRRSAAALSAAPRAQRDLPGRGDPAHAVGQEDGAAGQEAAARRRRRASVQARRDGQRRQRAWFTAFARRRAVCLSGPNGPGPSLSEGGERSGEGAALTAQL